MAGTALVRVNGFIVIGNDSGYVFSAPFSQPEVVQLAVNQAATVRVDAIPGLALPAKVVSIATSVTQVGGVPEYYAEVILISSDPRLRNGQTGSVGVTVATANNVLSVPSSAPFTGANDATQVDVWSGGKASPTTVQIRLVGSTLTQITSGLQAGHQVRLSRAGPVVLPVVNDVIAATRWGIPLSWGSGEVPVDARGDVRPLAGEE